VEDDAEEEEEEEEEEDIAEEEGEGEGRGRAGGRLMFFNNCKFSNKNINRECAG
jgi:hypothetical protein